MKITAQTGKQYGIPTEAEWEMAARTYVDVREFIDKKGPRHGLRNIADLQAWLIGGEGFLENFVLLDKGEKLTTGARLLTDSRDSEFQRTLENAHFIGCWTMYGTESGSLNPEEAYYDQAGRGPVKFGKPNAKGLYDMTGGMWEHCVDVYEKDGYRKLSTKNHYNAPTDKQDKRPRVVRGGSWSFIQDTLRAACRGSTYISYPIIKPLLKNIGGRMVAPAQDSK